MSRHKIVVLTFLGFLVPLQTFACTSFAEMIFPVFVYNSSLLIIFLASSLFLYKIFGGKRYFEFLLKIFTWFTAVLVTLLIVFALYSHFAKNDNNEEVECVGQFCDPLC